MAVVCVMPLDTLSWSRDCHLSFHSRPFRLLTTCELRPRPCCDAAVCGVLDCDRSSKLQSTMAHTAHKDPEQVKARFEPPVSVDRKAEIFADLIRTSKHFVAFTGAGISTSAGIPDFRGPEGVWTLRDQGRVRTSKTTSTLQAIPTAAHMALVELQNRGLLKYLVSQNCDGLHRRSGILPDKISELHGNSNREYCQKCGKEYIRDYRAVADYAKTVHDHRTGRNCARCGGELHDSIINFGEPLPSQALQKALKHAERSDLCLVLGSSLTVSPANTIPQIVGQKAGAKLGICNLQKTPLDPLADVRVYAPTDQFMIRVMEKLGLAIPPFLLRRRLLVEQQAKDGRQQFSLQGVDVDGTPVSFLRSVGLDGAVARSEPFLFNLRGVGRGMPLTFDLAFMGHYGEPNLELHHTAAQHEPPAKTFNDLTYDPKSGKWEVSKDPCPADKSLGNGSQVDIAKMAVEDGKLRDTVDDATRAAERAFVQQ